MQTSNHILAKEGILTNFLISKRITSFDVKKLREKLKTSKTRPEKVQEVLVKTLSEEIQQAFDVNLVPGLMVKEIVKENEERKKLMELTYFASIIAKKLTEQNTDKYHCCFTINALVNMLGLTEEDFVNFHKRFAKFKEGKPDDEPESE